jgi:hypothetical protein
MLLELLAKLNSYVIYIGEIIIKNVTPVLIEAVIAQSV